MPVFTRDPGLYQAERREEARAERDLRSGNIAGAIRHEQNAKALQHAERTMAGMTPVYAVPAASAYTPPVPAYMPPTSAAPAYEPPAYAATTTRAYGAPTSAVPAYSAPAEFSQTLP